MKRADLEAYGATFTEECVEVGPGGRRYGGPTSLEFPVFQRLRPLSMDDVGGPNDSSISRGAFRFESNLFARRASFTLSVRDWLAAVEVNTLDLAWKQRAVLGKPARGAVAGVRGWVIKIPLQSPRVYKRLGAAEQARAYWQATVNGDGRLDRHAWRMYIEMAVSRLIHAAVVEGIVDEAR